jgi:hypothetical protein
VHRARLWIQSPALKRKGREAKKEGGEGGRKKGSYSCLQKKKLKIRCRPLIFPHVLPPLYVFESYDLSII